MVWSFALVALVFGCGGSAAKPTRPDIAAPGEYPGLRFVPARPTYAFAARSVREAQRGFGDLADTFGLPVDVDRVRLGGELRGMFGVDPLSPEAVAEIGIDLDGGIAVFSAATDPTFVVHLAAPAETTAFLDRRRAQAPKTQSVVIDGSEIFSARIAGSVGISWTVDRDWLWVHFAFGADPEDTSWFTARNQPATPSWTADWAWASGTTASPSVLGFVDVRALLGKLSSRIATARACVSLVEPVSRVAVAVEARSGGRVAAKLALDVGPSSAALRKAILPAPEGFASVASGAPVSAQWNLDLTYALAALRPCMTAFGHDVAAIESYGIRSARIALRSIEPGALKGTGVVMADLASKRHVAGLLDQIPFRSRFEDKKQFGPFTGRHLSVPMVPDVDYVLTDQVAFAAIGDGLLARAVGSGKPVTGGPILAIDLVPGAMPAASWTYLLELAEVPRAARIVEGLARWRDLHFGATLDGSRLVVEASGNRR
ncbi:MAG: hypothetical protein WKG01_37530 [Kofleriaceae bacterium]